MSLSHGTWQARSPTSCPCRSDPRYGLDIECSCPSVGRFSKELSSPSPRFFLRVLIGHASGRFTRCSRRAATDVSSNLFQLSGQVAEQYVAPWGQCLRLVLPPASKPRAQVSHYELTEQGRAALSSREPCSVKARALLTRLGKKPSGLRRSSRSPGPADLLHDLKARGWVVEIQAVPLVTMAPLIQPNRLTNQDDSDITASLIPDPAMSWAEPLFKALRGPGSKQVLIQAPWPDRLKLLQLAIRLVLDRGQTVLIIVGEAERAQWITGLIRNDERGISPICFIAVFQTS